VSNSTQLLWVMFYTRWSHLHSESPPDCYL